ncbi:hypothetical protein PRZ48_011549 [Zasmidium cellare]|uniref:SEC7 domain-containing protein n=1 Tax=Zasmidium cellare TaxID=395010 RepID=A0ABR0E701_ZASCE|nr:hypothetical protein PRZ48_011549 [Zasmidium cellare]
MDEDDDPHASASASTPNARYHSPPSSPSILPGTRTSSRGFQNANSPPVTPPNKSRRSKGKGKQSLRPRLDRDWTDEIDAQQQPDNAGVAASAVAARHSHGLSWNSTTRDSVVDNLLFSLDNLSRQDVSEMEGSRDDDEKQRYLSSLASQFEPSNSPRGHAHSSSTSDYDRQMPDSPQSKMSESTKGRRSNSSSNFTIQNNLAGRMAKANAMGRSSTSDSRPKYVTGHSFVARKQSSEANSVDYGYSTVFDNNNRLALGGGRSVSMDQIQTDSADGPSVLDRGRPVPSVHSKYEANGDADAAPEPIIAAGPRKMQNPTATGPVFVGAQSKTKPAALRKTTTQQDLRSAAHTPSPPIPQDIRDQAADFVRTSSMRGNLPPPSAQTMGSAPSPGIAPRRRDPSPPRERPGFFKRVFGSSSRTVSSPVERPSSNQVRQDGSERPSTNAQSRSISQTSAAAQPKTEAKTTANTAMPQPPTLSKKPSSFFRRRKKSTSEVLQPPPLPVNTNLSVKAAEPSPSISSLRKVMDPFLTTDANAPPVPKQQRSRPPTASSNTEDSEDPDIFHSGYTPPPDASLGARHPVSREHSRRPTPEPEESPNQKMKIKKRRPDTLVTSNAQGLGDESYLQEPGRKTSTVSINDDFNDLPKVSPLSDVTPNISRPKTPGSRPSTGERIISQENSPIESPPGEDMRDFSAGTGLTFDMNDEGWIVQKHPPAERPQSKKETHLRLQPSEEQLSTIATTSPDEKVITPPALQIQSDENELPIRSQSAMGLSLPTLQIERTVSRNSSEPTIIQVPPEIIDEGAEYRERARRIFEGDEEDVSKADAASWLGERNTLSTRTLQAYMQLFDFSGLNILGALRVLCTKLVLRGETQQFDRIITAISARWVECNPSHGFKAQDVVHTIIYSLILLNTDLHLADIGEKMSRSAYVKNTLPTIKRVVADAAPNAFDDTLRPGTLSSRPTLPWSDSSPALQTTSLPPPSPANVPASVPSSPRPDAENASNLYTAEQLNSSGAGIKRMSIRPGMMRNDSDSAAPDSAQSGTSNALVDRTWTGSMRGWEVEIEVILKTFYTSIRADPLPLHGAMANDLPSGNRNLSVVDLNGNLKRTGSVVSRTPSDNMSFRSKQDFRSMTMRWQGRSNRSRPKLYPASTAGSSRTSFDEGSGFWSPAQSSKYSFSKTLTSASVGSFNHHFPSIDSFKHSIGFANALSQAIIREETAGGDNDSFSMLDGLLEDDALALQGAPWAKEGMVKHKHHMETTDRKAKDRNWTECFAVISKGKLTLFDFNKTSKSQSMGRKGPFNKPGKAASVAAKQVGGGDWMENAEQLDTFILRQTIASTLPNPGYSKARPHVWALSLPSGAVHLFHVGTPEIAVEFMTTANYWSARLSKEPLAGGVSNIEYGWSDQIINPALLDRSESFQHPPSSMQSRNMGHTQSMSTDRRTSLHSSIRGSFDAGFGGSIRAKLPGDKTTIHEWQPPSQSMMASQLMEVDQLKQLTTYVQTQEEELERHNELKHAIELAYSPRHPNFNKSMANWQRKSDYLLREIVKFRTYIDSLTAAQKVKETYYAKKAEGRLSPVAKRDDDDVHELPAIVSNMNMMMGDVTPRGIHTSG